MTKRELSAVAREVSACTKCRLCQSRTKAVPGEGAPSARIMIVGEAPGRREDMVGRPFMGQAGKVLERALASAGLRRDNLFITSVVKCRPPDNRVPKDDELKECIGYLERQVDAIKPGVVVLLGRTAQMAVTGKKGSLQRGPTGTYRAASLYITYHPAVALHGRPQLLEALVEDLKAVVKMVEAQASYGS